MYTRDRVYSILSSIYGHIHSDDEIREYADRLFESMICGAQIDESAPQQDLCCIDEPQDSAVIDEQVLS